MRNGYQRGEEVRAREQRQTARAQQLELAEEQRRGDEIGDDERRLVDRNERTYLRELGLRERRASGEDHRGNDYDTDGETPVARLRRQRRQEQAGRVGVSGLHPRLTSTSAFRRYFIAACRARAARRSRSPAWDGRNSSPALRGSREASGIGHDPKSRRPPLSHRASAPAPRR